jgi:hypothetical protein
MNRKIFTLIIALCIGAASFAQLTGEKFIPGSGGPNDYATLAEAITALNSSGVGSPGVTFSIAADYTETFSSPIAGRITTLSSSITNTIVFRKDPTTSGANPLITAGIGTTTNLDGIIVIVGSDYVTFDGIDLAESAANADQTARMEFGYAMVKATANDACQNVTIKNCTITLNKYLTETTSTTCYGIYSGNHLVSAIAAANPTAPAGALYNSQFFSNTITNVTHGIYINGYNSAGDFTLQNNNIEIGFGGSNTITNFNGYGIHARYIKALKVANNSIASTTATPSSITGIFVANTPDWDVYNNTITLAPTAGFSALTGITVQSGFTGYTCNIYNNTVQNCSNNSTPGVNGQAFTGISSTASATTVNFYSNSVNNNNIPGGGTNFFSFTGMISSGATTLNMYGNTVSNNTKYGISGNFDCLSGGATTANIYNNNIYSNFITPTAGAGQGGTINGIIIASGSLVKLYKNQVYDLSTAGSSSSAIVNGIRVNSGTDVNVYNNFVSDLRAPATSGGINTWVNSIAAIFVSGGTNVNVTYNTVYLDATSTGTYFTTSALYATTTPTLNLRNNVLVNNSTIDFENYTGYVLAYRRSGNDLTNYSNSSNANVFYANEAEENFTCGTFWNSDNLVVPFSFDQFQALAVPRESGSFSELPPFVNVNPLNKPYNLHLQTTVPTYCENTGLPITSPIAITDDFDGNSRGTTPDIGADEFNGISAILLFPPVGVSATQISSTQINVSFTPNPSNNNVLIVWNNTGSFTAPSGPPPAVNSDFAGGKVLSYGTSSPILHQNLTGATAYYYKAFSYNLTDYSLGVTVFATTNIGAPASFTANAVSSTQINLAWTKNAFNNDVIVATNSTTTFGQPVNGTVYSVGNTLPAGGGTVIYVGPLNAFSHTGLTPNLVTYNYKAWSYEPANNHIYSPTGITASATTLCGTSSVPFTESFEYPFGDVGCGAIVDQNNDGRTWQIYFGAPYFHTGQASLAILNNGFPVNTLDEWYFTKGLELTGGITYTVDFWMRTFNTTGPQNLEVKWGTSPTVAGMTSPAIYTVTGFADLTFQKITCSFTPASTGVYNVGWHCFSTAVSNRIFVDDISVYDPLFANWSGAVSSDWANELNWLPNSVPGSGTNVYIPGGLTNYPTISSPASCNNITIASGASLLDNGNLTVSGAATVNRNYTGGEWHLISSPISNATANMFLDLYLQNHTESTNAYTDITLTTTPLNVMQGYALWNNMAGTASFVGSLNTGNVGAANNVTRNGQGWNLLGNPYPSPIDWDAASGWTKTNVDNATYRHVNSAVWASYVGGVGVNGGSRYIPSCQGFFVGVNSGFTVGTLNMTNAVRTHSTSTFFKDEVSDIVRLEVSGNGITDETVIRFLDDATPEFDGLWDAHKLFGDVAEAPAIYSSENGMMAINSLPETNTVPIGVKAGVPGVFTIAATETSEFSDVILEDLQTGTITDLKTNSYTFNYDMSFDNRFIVHFTPLAVGENPADLVNIYSSQKDVYVSVPANTQGDIVVYNLMGQEVARSIINGVNNKITLNKSAYYVIKVVSNETVVAKKVFVN